MLKTNTLAGRPFDRSTALAIACIAALGGPVCHAAAIETGPLQLASLVAVPNVTYLSDTNWVTRHSVEVLDPGTIRGLRQRYDDLSRDYDTRRAAGLVTPEVEQAHNGALAGLSQEVTDRIKNYQKAKQLAGVNDYVKKKGDEVKGVGEQLVNSSPVAKVSVGAVAVAAAIYAGAPYDFKVAPWLSLSGFTRLKDQTGRLAVRSAVVDGSVDFSGQAPEHFDPTKDPMQQGERVKLCVSKDLPILHLSTGFTYGSTSSTVAASLNEQILPNLKASLASLAPIPVGPTDVRVPQGTLQVSYGLNF